MKPSQIRGILLEEAVLHLLMSAGYVPVYRKGSDVTLEQNGYSLFVRGRGERHQIDAIADYRVQPPFSNPQRLLLEAKFYNSRQVGLNVIRNAVGVLNDVSQFFVAPRGHSPRKLRYHYQYAVVSATRFTQPSQKYAYAHDVFLIPLGASTFFSGLLRAIRQAAEHLAIFSVNQKDDEFSGSLRRKVRDLLARRELSPDDDGEDALALRAFLKSCFRIRFAIIAVSKNGFPLFLVPEDETNLSELEGQLQVRIRRDNAGWFLQNDHGRRLFSFDVPLELLELYEDRGELTAQAAFDMKQQELNEMQAVIADGQSLRVVKFLLDIPWLDAIRRKQ